MCMKRRWRGDGDGTSFESLAAAFRALNVTQDAIHRNAEILRAVASLDAARNLLSASASDIAHSKRFVDDIDLMCAVLLSQVD